MKGIEVKENNGLLIVIVPKEVTGDFQNFFMNVSTSLGSFRMDRTAWKLVEKKAE
jgi:hypothetical protein